MLEREQLLARAEAAADRAETYMQQAEQAMADGSDAAAALYVHAAGSSANLSAVWQQIAATYPADVANRQTLDQAWKAGYRDGYAACAAADGVPLTAVQHADMITPPSPYASQRTTANDQAVEGVTMRNSGPHYPKPGQPRPTNPGPK